MLALLLAAIALATATTATSVPGLDLRPVDLYPNEKTPANTDNATHPSVHENVEPENTATPLALFSNNDLAIIANLKANATETLTSDETTPTNISTLSIAAATANLTAIEPVQLNETKLIADETKPANATTTLDLFVRTIILLGANETVKPTADRKTKKFNTTALKESIANEKFRPAKPKGPTLGVGLVVVFTLLLTLGVVCYDCFSRKKRLQNSEYSVHYHV